MCSLFYSYFVSEMIKIDLICFMLHLVMVTNGSRKVKGGEIKEHSSFVAYLLQAPISRQKYNASVCVGAIVSQYFIVTSSACVEDVEYMYAITGVRDFNHAENLKSHHCASKMKKVVMTCVPAVLAYEFDYEFDPKWTNIDIAVIKVESPFHFHIEAPMECNSIHAIDINYDPKYQRAEIDTQVYGWGSSRKWRTQRNNEDWHNKILSHTPLLIQPKSVCYEAFKDYNLTNLMKQYMICVNSSGNIDGQGYFQPDFWPDVPNSDGCDSELEEIRGAARKLSGHSCSDKTRRDLDEEQMNDNKSRRNFGICQNDLGSPLVTFIGLRQYLIGVASAFKVTKAGMCDGPFLFTSTQYNGAFLDCVINEKERSATSVCNKSPDVRGFAINKKIISWKDHPDGPAKNEESEN